MKEKMPLVNLCVHAFALLCFFAGLFLFFAWASFSPFDVSFSTVNSMGEVQNGAGFLGANIIDLLYSFFGQVGHLFPFFFLFAPLLWFLYSKSLPQSWLTLVRYFVGGILFLSGLSSLATALPMSADLHPFYTSGGVLGGELAMLFTSLGYPLPIFYSFAALVTLMGFFLCDGWRFCLLLRRIYRWIMLQPQEETPKVPAPKIAHENDINLPISVAEEKTETVFKEAKKEPKVKIYGLSQPQQTVTVKKEPFIAEDLVTEESLALKEEPHWQPSEESEVVEVKISPEPQPTQVVESEVQAVPVISMPQKMEIKRPAYTQMQGKGMQARMARAQYLQAQRVRAKFGVSPVVEEEMPKENPIQEEKEKETSVIPQEEKVTASLSKEKSWHQFNETENLFVAQEKEEEKHTFSPIVIECQEEKALSVFDKMNNENEKDLFPQSPTPIFQSQIKTTPLPQIASANEEVNAAVREVASTMPITEEVEEVEKQENTKETVYKPYGNSLIHPALQKKMDVLEKPTTPMPSIELLDFHPTTAQNITETTLNQTSARIEHLLKDFGVKAEVKEVLVGPVVTRYELELQPGVKAAKVTSIESDLARALLFPAIRVAEVIPGKPYVGIETPNAHRQTVFLREVLDSDAFRNARSPLSMALGKDISGQPVVVDLASMPHLLVAGATGSGKSVGVNTMILSLLFKVKPEEVKFIMIDPKVVELSVYNGIPHLLTEVVTDMKKAANALRWCVDEMERRYQLLAALSVRNIEGYNEQIQKYDDLNMPIPNPLWKPSDTMDTMPPPLEKLPYIVVIVDEFADLMMMVGKQVEELIARLAQKARAIGIHLILATQRPSVDVITGLIKANVPTRIAFSVASKIDSRTILDQGGAEALLGRGDMLYAGKNALELTRVHGAFMTDEEVVRVANDWRARGKPNYIDGILDYADEEEESSNNGTFDDEELDDLFDDVADFVISTGTTSVSSLQRRFRIGFNRAARIMDQLEEQGIVSPMQNGKREILARNSDY